MRKILLIMVFAMISIASYAKPHCQSFNNYDNKVTIIFTDDNVGDKYAVTDDNIGDKYSITEVKLIPLWMGPWKGKEYKATSVSISINEGIATVTLTFDHITQFSNPRVELKINGKKATFKVCQ